MPRRTGRPPKPTAVKRLAGNPGKRAMNKSEPIPDAGVPTIPSHLTASAKREWRRIVPLLDPLGLVTRVDRTALAAYCAVYARWVECELKLADGLITTSPNGHQIQSPYLAIANRALSQMDTYLADFGMTPAARTRVRAKPKTTKQSRIARLRAIQGGKRA